MSINTIQRAFEQRPPKITITKLKESKDLNDDSRSFFTPTQMISRGAERATPQTWVEKIIEYFTSLFGQPSREDKRSQEVETVLSNIIKNYNSNDPILYRNNSYQIEKNSLGEIVLYKYKSNYHKFEYFNTDIFAMGFGYNAVASPITAFLYGKQIKEEVKILVNQEYLNNFLAANKIGRL